MQRRNRKNSPTKKNEKPSILYFKISLRGLVLKGDINNPRVRKQLNAGKLLFLLIAMPVLLTVIIKLPDIIESITNLFK